jgi:hypothetical protein
LNIPVYRCSEDCPSSGLVIHCPDHGFIPPE